MAVGIERFPNYYRSVHGFSCHSCFKLVRLPIFWVVHHFYYIRSLDWDFQLRLKGFLVLPQALPRSEFSWSVTSSRKESSHQFFLMQRIFFTSRRTVRSITWWRRHDCSTWLRHMFWVVSQRRQLWLRPTYPMRYRFMDLFLGALLAQCISKLSFWVERPICGTRTAAVKNFYVSFKIREGTARPLTLWHLWASTAVVVCRDKNITAIEEGPCVPLNSQINFESRNSSFGLSMMSRLFIPFRDSLTCSFIYICMTTRLNLLQIKVQVPFMCTILTIL